jgi:hypothetical protein
LLAIFQQTEACYAYRRDFHRRLTTAVRDRCYATGRAYVGSDLAACTHRWWLAHGQKLDGMILGAEAWDPVFRQLADETNPGRTTCLKDVICHERHASYWESAANRYSLRMQRQTVTAAWRFFAARGIDPASRWVCLEGFEPELGASPGGPEYDLIVLGLSLCAADAASCLANMDDNLPVGLRRCCFVCLPPAEQRALQAKQLPGVYTVAEPASLPRERYQRMACLRNQVLRVLRNSGAAADALLWIDMDCFGFWQARDPIAKLLARSDWDAVAAYGLRALARSNHDVDTPTVDVAGVPHAYYDWLAYEDLAGRRIRWRNKGARKEYNHGKIPRGTELVREPVAAVNGARVHSAFGPACFYRPAAIAGLTYDEHSGQCEHQGFHAAMRQRGRDRIYVSEDVVALYDDPSTL